MHGYLLGGFSGIDILRAIITALTYHIGNIGVNRGFEEMVKEEYKSRKPV